MSCPKAGRDPLGWDDPLRDLVRSIEEIPCAGHSRD